MNRLETISKEVIGLVDLKQQLRLTGTSEDAYLTQLISVARVHIEDRIGRAFAQQRVEESFDCFPAFCGGIEIPFAPVLALESISYKDTNGDQHVLDLGLVRLSATIPAYIYPIAPWPLTAKDLGNVKITYRAGVLSENGGTGSIPNEEIKLKVPQPIRHAVLLLASYWFHQRYAASEQSSSEVPFSVSSLISSYRQAWF